MKIIKCDFDEGIGADIKMLKPSELDTRSMADLLNEASTFLEKKSLNAHDKRALQDAILYFADKNGIDLVPSNLAKVADKFELISDRISVYLSNVSFEVKNGKFNEDDLSRIYSLVKKHLYYEPEYELEMGFITVKLPLSAKNQIKKYIAKKKEEDKKSEIKKQQRKIEKAKRLIAEAEKNFEKKD